MKTETEVHYELIATRQPPGDKWLLVDDISGKSTIYPTLTDTLEAWFQKNQEEVSFRLDPLDSKLYIIREEEIEIKPEPPKRFSLYGEYSQQ